jgi:membrane-bound ClpP family serine protease
MTLPLWAISLFALAVVLLVAEALLPTHGVLGVGAVLSVLAAIVVCYVIDLWLGTGVFFGTVLAAPLLGALAVRVWPHTPVGRRVILPPVKSERPADRVLVGQTGYTVSELRPMGIVEFDLDRVEAISEHGIIDPGRPVKVVAVQAGRPMVRAV